MSRHRIPRVPVTVLIKRGCVRTSMMIARCTQGTERTVTSVRFAALSAHLNDGNLEMRSLCFRLREHSLEAVKDDAAVAGIDCAGCAVNAHSLDKSQCSPLYKDVSAMYPRPAMARPALAEPQKEGNRSAG